MPITLTIKNATVINRPKPKPFPVSLPVGNNTVIFLNSNLLEIEIVYPDFPSKHLKYLSVVTQSENYVLDSQDMIRNFLIKFPQASFEGASELEDFYCDVCGVSP